LPSPAHSRGLLAETGRGLVVIRALAVAWGAAPSGDGKVVWAVLSTGG
jgi:hypothetical protein